MKLYVWEPALSDYYSGAIFVIASNLREARKAVLAEHASDLVKDDIAGKPDVYDLTRETAPKAWLMWGCG